MTDLLNLQGITGGYGEADIINDLSMTVRDGEIIVIVGPNGAGKSTAMRSVFGLLKIRGGRILFKGDEITHEPTDRIVRRGISYVPQTDNVFPTLTVHENLQMGAFIRKDDYSATLEKVYGLFPPLREKRRQAAGSLSGGQRQMVAMGKALMSDPQLLLLDEPTAGLSPKYMDQIFDIVKQVNELGIGIMMVEQNAKQALSLAHRGYVLTNGANRHEDSGPALLADRAVAEMFLGG